MDLAEAIRRRELSCVEVAQAHLDQIEQHNPALNAMVTLTPDLGLEQAQTLDQRLARGESIGPLGGLPVAHKDLHLTRGVRTTFGSLVYADHVPDENALIVDRMQQAGAVMLGKTNTPEFGAGSHTFNEVFGATRNPYNPSRSCGGSSGGAAVALAAGLVSLADGSDMGGSLRNPAAWCNVVGLRPTPGRVPSWPAGDVQTTLPVEGPMGRTVQDVALLLQAIAGPDARCPWSEKLGANPIVGDLERDFEGVRIAASPDFGGALPLVPDMPRFVENAASVFSDAGATVEVDLPDLSGVDETFRTLRAALYANLLGPDLDRKKDQYKSSLVWNVKQGLMLSKAQIAAAGQIQLDIRHRFDQFFEWYDFLLLPVTQVHPFPVEDEYPTEIAGETLSTYLDWMRSCYYVTVPGHPAISVPAGFTADNLPVGVQIVGRWGDDFGVLQAAYALQEATGYWRQGPPLAAGSPEEKDA